VRPRYRRITAALGAVATTLVAVLGALGWLPGHAQQATRPVAATVRPQADGPVEGRAEGGNVRQAPAAGAISLAGADTQLQGEPARDATALPPGSGTGRRIVFDISAQRVWLVAVTRSGEERVRRTYLASGSVSDNLQPGTYAVFSRSRHAWGIDDSGTMEYFVRFAHGENAAIGFHDIPVMDGRRVQTRAELGTPQSHGCIRQWRPDAKALWHFAPVGTTVVVVA
jgi:hypothetical protein